MKYLRALLCIFLVCILFSGCNLKISTSIDDLISPLSPFGENADVKNALDSYAKGGYSLKMASAGDYITSYIFYDLDGDSREEALAFYEPNDNLGTTQLAVIGERDGKRSVIEAIKGEGKEVHSVDFDDLNGDGKVELIVNWDVISKSTNHELCVYSVNTDGGGISLSLIGEPKTVNSFVTVDLTSDSKKELLLFEINSGSAGSAVAELYSLSNNTFTLLGSTRLDSHITSYEKISIDNNGSGNRVFADALKSDGASMLTEILLWTNTYSQNETIVSPYYSYATGLTSETTRTAMLHSMDINSNSLIDVPRDYEIEKLPEEVCGVEWCEYKNSVLTHSDYSLFAKNDGYIITLPEDGIDKVRVKYNKAKREMTIFNSETKKDICSVLPVLKATYKASQYPDYKSILESEGYVYLAKQGDDEEIVLPVTALSELIKPVN